MEGQEFNPTPTPEPGPAPTPTPDPAPEAMPGAETAQPVPQDSFAAQSEVNPNAAWQPTQATAPQVGGMNVPPVMAQPEPEKNNKIGVIIAIVVAVLIFGGILAVVLLNNGGNGGKRELTAQEKQRNIQREDDMRRFQTAVEDYKVNNNGKNPFVDGETMERFTIRYIDQDCTGAKSELTSGTSLKVTFTSCGPQFTDPYKGDSGFSPYGWTVTKTSSSDKDKDFGFDKKELDHLVHVFTNAKCGSSEGTYTYSDVLQSYALFYIEEGEIVYCADSDGGGFNNKENEPKKDASAGERTVDREDDVARFIISINDFQTDNSGKTPFSMTGSLKNFVTSYIDDDCFGGKTYSKGKSIDGVQFESCSGYFSDPDGTPYKILNMGTLEKNMVFEGSFDYTFYVYTKASCGSSADGALTTGRGEREVAVLLVDEDGSIICNDNH